MTKLSTEERRKKLLEDAKESMVSYVCGYTGFTREQVLKLLLATKEGTS